MPGETSALLRGQRALVTGANSGIGAEVAKALAKAGASVLINYLVDEAAAADVVEEITADGGNARAFQADVSQEAEVKAMFQMMIAEFGSIDILVLSLIHI